MSGDEPGSVKFAEWRTTGEKQCARCRETLAVEQFHWRSQRGEREPSSYCKACYNARCAEKRKANGNSASKAYKERNKPTERLCRSCGTVKAIELFEFTDRGAKGKVPGRCLDCVATGLSYHQQYYDANKERIKEQARTNHIKRAYGLTLEEYEAMVEAQGGRCAICNGFSDKALYVDHNHATGYVRALLCQGCNSGLGNFRDNPYALGAAIEYLKRFSD